VLDTWLSVPVYGFLRTLTLRARVLTTDCSVFSTLSSAPFMDYSMFDTWRFVPITDISVLLTPRPVLPTDASVLNT